MGTTTARVVGLVCAVLVGACAGSDDVDEAAVVLEVVTGPPTILSLSPASGTQQTQVVINGSNFVAGATVAFNGTVATQVTFTSAAKLKAIVPTGATTGPVTVTTGLGTGTSAVAFNVKPLVGTFDPAGGFPGSTVTVHGSGFTGAIAATLNGTPMAYAVVDDATITATVPTGIAAGKITVKTPQGNDTSAAAFAVFPAISGFSPGEGIIGSSVTITGGGFTAVTGVQLGTKAMSFTHVDDATIVAIVPANASKAAIKVITPAGSRTSTGTFTVIKKPTITSFTPGTAPLPATVTILGTNLSGTSSVSIGGYALTVFTVDPNKVTVTVPAGAPVGKFTVVNAAGSATSAGTFVGYPDLCVGVTCVASDACHAAGTCEPLTGACSNPSLADGTSCSDGTACTQTDSCQAGVCTGANPVVCADPEPCHDTGTCNAATGACDYAVQPDGTSCAADACTLAGTCSGGTCDESVSCDVPITDGLIANWNAEGNAEDDAGDHDGISVGVDYRQGQQGYEFDFYNNAYVEVPDSDDLDLGTSDFTVTFWVWSFGAWVDGDDGMIHKDSWDGTTGRGWLFNVDSAGGGVGFMTRDLDAGVSTSARVDMSTVSSNAWHHFAGVRQGNVLSFYIDGTLRASASEASPTDVSNAISLRIGSSSPAAPQLFYGGMDDVRIYNRALVPDELVALHTCLPNYCVPNTSCDDVLETGRSTGDGYYWVNLPNYSPIVQHQVYCDMTTDGGGWTLGVNIDHDLGPTNLTFYQPFSYADRTSDTQYRLTCTDAVYGVDRKMFVTGVNPGDPNAWRAAGIVDKTNLVCSQSSDFSSPQFGASCLLPGADTDNHTYWGNPAWDMAWALYNVDPAYTLRHCRNTGSGWWNPGRLWYR